MPEDDYKHGVIFYLRDEEVVGIVLWNLDGFMGDPSRLDIARQVFKLCKYYRIFASYMEN